MNTRFKKMVLYGLSVLMLVALVLTIAACTKTTTSSNIPAATTVSPAATSNTPASSPSGSNQPRRGITGTLAAINGNSLTISTPQGTQATVTVSSGTLIEKTGPGKLSDLKPGQAISVIGAQNAANASIDAASIVARPSGQSQAPVAGAGAGALGGRIGQGASGTIAAINASSLTLNTTQGSQETVNISPATTIELTTSGTAADLKTGQFLTVVGSADSSGSTAATAIVISSQLALASPSPTPSASPTPSPTATLVPATGSASSRISTRIPTVAPPGPTISIAGPPVLLVTAPLDASALPAGDVTITTIVTNFNLVNKVGQAAAPGEGHLIYYLDVAPPVASGAQAYTNPGTYAETTTTTYTWHNVPAGFHYFSVQAVNNDGTPFIPAIKVTVYVTLQSQ